MVTVIEFHNPIKHQRGCLIFAKKEEIMLQIPEQLRLHRESVQSAQHVADDAEYRKVSWWAFRWFLAGVGFSAIVGEAIRIVVHHWR